jgi:hypothetical protein
MRSRFTDNFIRMTVFYVGHWDGVPKQEGSAARLFVEDRGGPAFFRRLPIALMRTSEPPLTGLLAVENFCIGSGGQDTSPIRSGSKVSP